MHTLGMWSHMYAHESSFKAYWNLCFSITLFKGLEPRYSISKSQQAFKEIELHHLEYTEIPHASFSPHFVRSPV